MSKFIFAVFLSLSSVIPLLGQIAVWVPDEGVVSPLHRANVGKITFMARPVPWENYGVADFLRTFELKDVGDLNIRVFLAHSLTNYLHQLAPALSANGGNKIFVFKDYPLVIVVTAQAYNKPYMHRQVDKIVANYLLPAIFHAGANKK